MRLLIQGGGFSLTGLFIRRNPGVDFGPARRDLDELPDPLRSGKRKQVQHGEFGLQGKCQEREILMPQVADAE